MDSRHSAPAPIAGARDTRSPGQARKVCIFSHFDRDSIVRRYVFPYVEAIAACGFEILFVSTADRVSPEDRDRLRALGAKVHKRENKGLDFGSWQYGMHRLVNLDEVDQLLLANDSVFGPLFDLKLMFDRMDRTNADFWGVTDSYEGKWHLQSYFLCFDKAVLRSSVFREFFRKDFHALPKRQVISQGEIALSQELILAGFTGMASCPYGALTPGRFDRVRNPTQHYWDELIEKCRCPFVKLLLLRENPNGVENLDRWREVIARETDYDITLIEDYLAAFGEARRKPSPLAAVSLYLNRLPYVTRLALRAAIKACTHPQGTVLALEQYLATDPGRLPPHPGSRPTVAYCDLDSAEAGADPGPVAARQGQLPADRKRRRA